MLHLTTAAQTYFNLGISTATRKAYTANIRWFTTFCSQTKQQAVPASKETLLLFATYLAQQGLSYSIIQVYLSAVRYAHIAAGKYSKTIIQTTPLNQPGFKKDLQITSYHPTTYRKTAHYFSNYETPAHSSDQAHWELK